ncbi:UBC-like protein [Microstroma glucosiphilum]|uniref:UBC-like protein n=1 Tax=Pseudomicrostroma glucosiphilum TaxID=1684307 RepID=A0A316UBD6_9BASI|nr:UBC-like protein [Pseudomicrostroma glucosiphilum]PWN21713.1 UBC-like protein [Pseudomicrostroma glucosiphilum]
MASKAAIKRLTKEYQMMEKDPPPFCFARPLESDILTWHFILRGPPGTPYEGGEYWGQLIFPSDYPFKAPGMKVATPNGRFTENALICTSMSNFHQHSWNPSWSVANILIGLHSFMNAEDIATGAMTATPEQRKTWASRSHSWNVNQPRFKKIFPEYAADSVNAVDLPNMGQTMPPKGKKEKAGDSSSPAKAAPGVGGGKSE